MWDNLVGFMIYHDQRIDQASGVTTAIKHTLRCHAFRVIADDASLSTQSYLGRYKFVVNLLATLGFLGKIYYKSHYK